MSSLEDINASQPWVEKYRPSTFDEIVLEDINRACSKILLILTVFQTYYMALLNW